MQINVSSLIFSTDKMSSKNVPSVGSQSQNEQKKSSEMGKKSQCDMCKLSYSSEKELLEHNLSLMHHTKMEDREMDPVHSCSLCNVTCHDMAQYRAHIGTTRHQRNLSILRGEASDEEMIERGESSLLGPYGTGSDSNFGNNKGFFNGTTKKPPNFRFGTPSYQFDAPNFRNQNWNTQPETRFNGQVSSTYQKTRMARERRPYNDNVWRSDTFSLPSDRIRFGDKQQDSEKSYDQPRFEPWGSGAYGANYWGNGDNLAYANRNIRGKAKQNPGRYSSKYNQNFSYSDMDFTCDANVPDWDEHSFIQQEKFLAGMEDSHPVNRWGGPSSSNELVDTYQVNRSRPSSSTQLEDTYQVNRSRPSSSTELDDNYHFRRWGPGSSTETEDTYRVDRQGSTSSKQNFHKAGSGNRSNSVDSTERDRKRPRKAFEFREISTKSPRSEDHSQQNSTPVKEKSKLTPTTKSNMHETDGNLFRLPLQPPPEKSNRGNSIDDTSDNILERAERLCKQLREKREASGTQHKSLLKNQNKELLNQKINAISQKKKTYLKGHITESKEISVEENYDSGISLNSGRNKKKDAANYGIRKSPFLSLKKSAESKLDEIRKNIEKNVLLDTEELLGSKKKVVSPSTTSQHSRLLGEDVVESLRAENANKSTTKPPVRALSKDSLQKMVNAPRSRDERLKLAKMLHSREEHKDPPSKRTNLQLEGLYDHTSSNMSDVSLELGNKCDTPTIKLEDLSEGVRQQILALIGGDIMGNLSSNSSETPRKELSKKSAVGTKLKEKKKKKLAKTSQEKLTSAETLVNKNQMSKKKKAEANSKAYRRAYDTSSYKSLKTQPELDNTATPAVTSSKILPPQQQKSAVTSSDHHRPHQHVITVDPDSGSDLEIVSGTSDLEPAQTKVSSPSNQPRSTPPKQLAGGDDILSPPGGNSPRKSPSPVSQTQLNSFNVMHRFPTIMGAKHADNIPQPSTVEPDPVGQRSTVFSSPETARIPETSISDPAGTTHAETLASLRLSLPPSRWLADEVNRRSTAGDSSLDQATSSPPNKFTSTLDVHDVEITSDKEEKSQEDFLAKSQPLCQDNFGSTVEPSKARAQETNVSEAPRQDLSELLTLSEREGDIKQEMMSMELRLTRLHRLLEQAVVQINKCTERRNQLLEEEQELSNRRISLLRDAAKQHGRSDKPDTTSSSGLSSNGAPPALLTTAKTPASEAPDISPNTSLSRADWLAKFSSYLPPEPQLKNTNTPGVRIFSLPATKTSQDNTRRVIVIESDAPKSPGKSTVKKRSVSEGTPETTPTSDMQMAAIRSKIRIGSFESDSPTAPTPVIASSLFSAPIMYLGSFRSSHTPMNLKAPVIMLNGNNPPSLFNNPHPHFELSSDSGAESSQAATYEDTLAQSRSSKPPISASSLPHATEDSDIGSVASSIASGSSLGEKITRYCRTTPFASLDTGAHELSTIMSDSNEMRSFEAYRQTEIAAEKDWDGLIKPCSVSLERIDKLLGKDTGIYGKLDKQAVVSAEALHVLERNCSTDLGLRGKKKKRKTRQERETSGLRHQRRHWLNPASSSSSDEGEAEVHARQDMDEAMIVLSDEGGEQVKNAMSEPVKLKVPDSVKDERLTPEKSALKAEVMSPSKQYDVVIAECDSSTHQGLVDTEGIAQRLKVLKEIKESFDRIRTYDRTVGYPGSDVKTAPSLPDKSVVKSPNTVVPELVESSETEEHHEGRRLPSGIKPGSSSEPTTQVNREEIPERDTAATPGGKPLEAGAATKTSCFQSGRGPVVELQVLHDLLYVAFCNSGISVYQLSGPNKEPVAKFPAQFLQCMSVYELQDKVIIASGTGVYLAFCDPKKLFNSLDNVTRIDLGTMVKCLLMVTPLMYAGLETGEICIVDSKTMEKKERFICSDRPVHCLALAQEGSSKIICVSSQDGTILVINANTYLPLRILTGHMKTAFTLQVEGHLVFSGSGDSTVFIHNLHTGTIEHVFRDNKGLVKSVFYSQGYLYTGGMDKLVRCYNTKTRELVRVYYGAERGIITKILVHDKKLITGNISGDVDKVDLDFEAEYLCRKQGCKLNFGNRSHLFWHILNDHNITDLTKERPPTQGQS
ncbi:microtubule-associated protein futsch-like isoform X2 [Physella acuta]|uniref:microtubule-associated protein futsch-like isoform X2 n=1 Tax=Physella acuta TaxID=109671 RepID=UPI0027DEA2EF|nr:microtubule-associated protein futsch-like isoform X2 [Physella acuta]